MSTIRATYVQHGSSAVPNITLNASGQVIVASGIVSSGTFAAPSGSVSAPGIYFNGDSNTGLYSPAADTIAFTEGGVEALRIDSSGRVGIGTSSPADTSSFGGVLDLSGSQGGALYVRNQTSASKYGAFGFYDTDIYVTTYATGNIRFNTGSSGAERMRITSAGNVGIGTSTFSDARQSLIVAPASGQSSTFLTVKGSSSSANTWLFFGDSDSDNTGGILYEHSTDAMAFRTSAGERFRCDSSGRLLVGTSSALPVYYNSASTWNGIFQVARSSQDAVANFSIWDSTASTYTTYGGAQIHLSACKSGTVGSHTSGALASGDSIASINFNASDGTNFRNAARIEAVVDAASGTADVPGRLVFATTADGASSPTERMRITNDGYALFNTTNKALRDSTSDVGLSIDPGAGGLLQLAAGGPTYFNRVSSDGSIIAFRRNGANVGSISVTGSATAYNTSSDYRLKENVTAVTDGIVRLQQLKPSRFNFIADPSTTVDGFIAHEVQTVVPEAIYGEKDEVDSDGNPIYQGIDQSKLVPLLTAALQEAVAKIESLEARLTAAGL